MSKKILLQEEFLAPPIRWENLTQFKKEDCIINEELPQEDSAEHDSPNDTVVAQKSTPQKNRPAAENKTPENNPPVLDNKSHPSFAAPQKRIISENELTTPPLRWEKLPQFPRNNKSPIAENPTPESDGFISELTRFKAQIAAAKVVPAAIEDNATITQRHAEAVARGHQEGHSQGFEQGYQAGLLQGQEEGMRLGSEQGRAQGIEQGRQDGLVQGQEAGHQEGLATGLEEGQQRGFAQGHEEGYAAGHAQGFTEGHTQGVAQGQEEGRPAGHKEGFAAGHAAGLQQGREEGHQAGHTVGLEEGRRDGHAQGLEQGRHEGFAQGETELKEKLSRLAKFLTALDKPFQELDPLVEEQIVALATLIARQVITRELKQDRTLIVAVVKEALANLPLARRNLRLFLHPDDLPLIQEALADSVSEASLIPDSQITAGGFRIETDNSRIDATVETRMNQVLSQLFGDIK